jgi:hypothetical protein
MHSTNNLNDDYLGSGKYLYLAIRKYGKENFAKEILEHLPNRLLLAEREKELITKELLADKLCMNLKGGGEGGFISVAQQRHRSLMANKALQKKKEDLEFFEDWKNKISLGNKQTYKNGRKVVMNFSWKNKTHSDNTKEKMRLAKQGKGFGSSNSQHGTCWIVNEVESKKIQLVELESYLTSGWKRGRIFTIFKHDDKMF